MAYLEKELETVGGSFAIFVRSMLEIAGRAQLKDYLERRGYAVSADDSLAERRQTALADWDGEKTTFRHGFGQWLQAARAHFKGYSLATYPDADLEVDEGPRYCRIVAVTHGQRSAWAFVDRKTGDVLKPAGWKGPAKHARGSVYDPNRPGYSTRGIDYLR